MAYTPTVWATGDIITAEKLNKAENGIAANSNIVYVAKGEVDDGVPVITEGDFDDACAVIEAGGIVALTLSVEGSGTYHYFSCMYVSGESTAIYLFNVFYNSGFNLAGFEWTESGLADWPVQ